MAAVGFVLWPDLELLPLVAPIIEVADYVEVTPETLWGPGGRPNTFHSIARSLAEAGVPLVGHGVGLDLCGEDDGRRDTWLERWRRDAQVLGYRWVSDHLGTTCIAGEPIGLPMPAPASFSRLSRSLDQLAMATGAPAAVENSAWYAYPGDALDEPARLADALADQHHLVLDLHNLWTNSVNLGFDPILWLERAPLDRVIELHISGGSWAPNAWTGGRKIRLDSHDGAVPEPVWQLVEDVACRCPALRGATLERIEGPISEAAVQRLLRELARLRAVVGPVGVGLGEPATPPAAVQPVQRTWPASAEERAVDRGFARVVRSPGAAAGEGVAHRLIVKLRFSRLMRGDDRAKAWFDDDPDEFTSTFRAYHQGTPCALTPWHEAQQWREWIAGPTQIEPAHKAEGEEPMNRRDVLMGALSLVALSATPLAFAGVSPTKRRALLGEAWRRAVKANEPLLVVIVPHGQEVQSRGQRLGTWLAHGQDQDLAPLAKLEMACATLLELDKLVPGVREADGAWMVLVRVDQPTPTWRSIVVPAIDKESEPMPFEDWVFSNPDLVKEDGDWDALQARWAEEQRAKSEASLAALLGPFRASAGRVFASEGLQPADRQVPDAARRARERWVQRAPAGAHWGSAGGCGSHIRPNPDDEPNKVQMITMCGMGRVTMYESRFLALWDVR